MTEVITRSEWGARPPDHRTTIPTPTPELILHHFASEHHGPEGMRTIQSFHMDSRGMSDIAYSFCVDHDGQVYEGRGAGVQGGHTKDHNSVAHAICAMGNYEANAPTPALIRGIADLVSFGHTQGWWPAQITHGHRDVGSTGCPGTHLYRAIPDINFLARTTPEDDPVTPQEIDAIALKAAEATVAVLLDSKPFKALIRNEVKTVIKANPELRQVLQTEAKEGAQDALREGSG